MSAYTVRPLTDRTWLRPAHERTASRFDSSWTQTLELLTREVDKLDGRYLVIGVDVPESALRLDGTLRARAKADSPAVEVAFDSTHGPMLYRCDRFTRASYYGGTAVDWRENVRAIALTLEALRAVDRYGASSSGEQYRGYRQIEAFPAPLAYDGPGIAQARVRLHEIGYHRPCDTPCTVPDEVLLRRARREAHPDRGGSPELWHEVALLAAVIGLEDGQA